MAAEQPERSPPGRQRTRVRLWSAAMLVLSCLAVVFILLAAGGFVIGLWRVLPFLAGILYYGPVTLELETFPRQLGAATANLLGPILYGAIAGLCLALGKRIQARLNLARQAADERAPVVYLRSFDVDKRFGRRPLAVGRVLSLHTEEEQLVDALREVGPVVAVGRPGERLPRLGARRVYLDDSDWQQQILSWFARAALVVIHIAPAPSEGLNWEIAHGLGTVPLERLVFLLSSGRHARSWLERVLRDRGFAADIATRSSRAPYGSRVSGIVHFAGGRAEFRPLVKPPFLRRPLLTPLVPVYRSALQPVTTRILDSWRPLSLGFGEVAIAVIWIAFCSIVVAAAIGLRRTNPLDREVLRCGQRLFNQLPPDARELAQRQDAALLAWMQQRVTSGLRYVPADVVLARASIVGQLLARASPADCAALAGGTLDEVALNKLLNEIGRVNPGALAAWCSSSEMPLLESLRSSHERAFPVSEADATSAFASLYGTLSDQGKARYRRVTYSFDQASADDRCWFARIMFERLDRLDEPSRSRLARIALGQDLDR